MTTRQDWFSAAELADMALPAMPTEKKNVILMAERRGWQDPAREGTWWRRRAGRGGGIEWHVCVLPSEAQVKIAYDLNVRAPDEPDPHAPTARSQELWRRYERVPDKQKEVAKSRLRMVQALDAVQRSGVPLTRAKMLAAAQFGVSFNSLHRWCLAVAGLERSDWLPALLPHHAGNPGKREVSEEAWQAFLADYLRPEKPPLLDCWRRVADAAPRHQWVWPSRATIARRVEALPATVVVLRREGAEALKQLYPAQQRDRGVFHALEAVNLDGHRWDVFVRWPDGYVGRPQMLAIQDLYSGRMMAWRIDRTLHQGLVRLAFGDLIEQFGVPRLCYFDNGRENASKLISGQAPHRHRFKIRDEDPTGLLPQLGVEVHFTTPYSGQSKPIERAFRDFASSIAKHPAFAGAYVGNKPDAKPENYGSAAVSIEEFTRVVGEELVRHNARVGRRSPVCGGEMSFDQAFFRSYAVAPIRKASAEQRRLCMMAADRVRSDRRDGTVSILGNRYWDEALSEHRGQPLVVRFDPADLHTSVHVFRLDGTYVAEARCREPVGFADMDGAREQMRARKAWARAQRDLANAEQRMSLRTVAALYARQDAKEPEETESREAKVIRPLFRVEGVNALKVQPDDEDLPEGEQLLLDYARMRRGELTVVDNGDD